MSVNRKVGRLAEAIDDDRPLAARSVIVSILLPLDPSALPGSRLVRAGELFGIAEGTSRVALSRMVAAGELEASDGVYRLSGALLRRRARQSEGRHPVVGRWNGRFSVAVVVAGGGRPRSAPERAALRLALARLRLAELREGIWLRPDNLGVLGQQRVPVVVEQCLWFTAETAAFEPTTANELAARLFDLESWAARATALRRALGETLPGLEAHDTAMLQPGFRAAAAVVRHLTADPLLPASLLPPGWPGGELRDDYDRYERAYRRLLRSQLLP